MNPVSRSRPLRVMFLHTSAVVGGAETLMLNLIRRMDRRRFRPELCCLKTLGPIGETLAGEIPTFERLLAHKYDVRVLPRLTALLRSRRIDAIVTVGAGDKMFWGRLAARLARVPVVLCAIHSTGWPDRIGRLNRALTPLTDAFIGVAEAHARYLIDDERFPREKVRIIPNGVDTERFHPREADGALRADLGIPPGPLAGTIARLTPEKNHAMMLDVAARVRRQWPTAQFLLVGDGPLGQSLRAKARELGIADAIHFLGWRSDIPEILSLLDVFLLTSHIEANPVCVLEALAAQVPVVATRVGSLHETVRPDTGRLVEPGDVEGMTRELTNLWTNPQQRQALGQAGRAMVERDWSLAEMVRRYEDLIEELYLRKCPATACGTAYRTVLPADHDEHAEAVLVHGD